MEDSNIWLERIEYQKSFRPVKWGSFGQELETLQQIHKNEVSEKKSYLISFQEVKTVGGLNLPRKSVVRLTDRPDMTLDVYRGRKTTTTTLLFIYLSISIFWQNKTEMTT